MVFDSAFPAHLIKAIRQIRLIETLQMIEKFFLEALLMVSPVATGVIADRGDTEHRVACHIAGACGYFGALCFLPFPPSGHAYFNLIVAVIVYPLLSTVGAYGLGKLRSKFRRNDKANSTEFAG